MFGEMKKHKCKTFEIFITGTRYKTYFMSELTLCLHSGKLKEVVLLIEKHSQNIFREAKTCGLFANHASLLNVKTDVARFQLKQQEKMAQVQYINIVFSLLVSINVKDIKLLKL